MKNYALLFSILLICGCETTKIPSQTPTDFSRYAPYNKVFFMHDENSLSKTEIRDIFEIDDAVPNSDLMDAVQFTGQKLIVQSRGIATDGKISGYGATIDGKLRSVVLDLNFINYRDIELTSEQLAEYQNIHPLKDAITRASVLYGYGLQLSSKITVNQTGVELDSVLPTLTANAKAGYYDVQIQQNIMGGSLGVTVSKLLNIVSDTESIDVANSVLNALNSDPSFVKPETVKRIGYLVHIDENKAKQNKEKLSITQLQKYQQALRSLGQQQQQQQVQQQQQLRY